jgi:hypothetical protein
MATKTVKLEELTQDPRNAREHSQENLDTIAESLKRFGAGRSIVVDKDGIVRAGSGTLAAARKAGFEKVMVVETDGKTLVAVRRSDWSDMEAAGYGIADNKSSELGTWNKARLRELFEEMIPADEQMKMLEATGFSEDELKALMDSAKPVTLDVAFTAQAPDPNTTCPKCGFQFNAK